MSANTCHPTEKMLRRLADLSSETPSLKLLDTTKILFFSFKGWLKKRSTLDVTSLLRAPSFLSRLQVYLTRQTTATQKKKGIHHLKA